MGSSVIVTIIIVVYLLFMLWIGQYPSTKISINTDFMMAGRRLGPLLMADTLVTAGISSGNSLGIARNDMSGFGLSASWYIATMGIAFTILSFMTPKFRTTTIKAVPEYFRRHYEKSCSIIAVIVMLLPLVELTAGQFIASAVILSTMLNIDYQVAVVTIAAVATVYSIMGGLWGVALIDFVQVFLIVIGMIVTVPFAMNYAGGWGNVALNMLKDALSLFQGYDLFGTISLAIMYTATFSVGQKAMSRFYAARDEETAKGDTWLVALVNFIYASVPTILGIITLALTNMNKFSSAQFKSVGVRYALPILAINTMSALMCGLLFAGIISATMSSSGSDLLDTGSIFTNDIHRVVLKPDASNQSVMRVTEIVVYLVGLVPMLIALFNTRNVVSILMFYFTLRAAGSFFPYTMGHYWKKASTAGTITSLIVRTIMVAYLEHVSKGILFSIKSSQPIIPGLTAAFIYFIIFSLVMPPQKETTELTPKEDDQIWV